ncbi:MAG TPA: T9SS type A sorting domain-containing protein [Chitinophagales bacterium]|nr:T9SS type A sorting domain-containing protein [Chitinophagales bacterium]
MKSLATTLFFFAAIYSHQLFGQAGNLDSTFNGNGKVITPIGNNHDVAFSVFQQPDGKIVVVGNTKSGDYDFALTRYNSDGSLDASFGINGIAITDITGSQDHALYGAVKPNGKIVAAGNAYMGVGPEYDFAVAQYNPDGTLDPNFGTNGMVTTPIGTGSDEGYGMALQSDGKIVVAGYAYIDPPQGFDKDFAVVRYDTTGALDNSFGINGIVTTDYDSTTESAHDVEIQSNGKIIVAGEISVAGHSDFAVTRYAEDGTLDVSWNNTGKVTTALDSNAYAYSIALQEDGKVVVAGHTGDLPNGDFALVRYNKDGSIDSTFGINGIVITDIAGSDDECYAVYLQPDGKILAAGHGSIGLTQRLAAVVRYNADGSLDNTFGSGGKVTTAFGFSDDEYRGMTLQQDGKIVACGYTNNQGNDDFAVARYLTDLSLDVLSFSSGENSVFIFPNPIQSAEELEYTLTWDEILSIELYDVGGKLVQSFITNEKRTSGGHKEHLKINENLPAGNYVLTLSNGSHSVSVKMVKQ